jgi:hypothetical protein
MADRNYSPYQQKLIRRFYENRDQMDDQRLSELVAELYLAGEKKKLKLWQTARELMTRLGVPAGRVEHVMASADPAILAEVVKDLQSGKIPKPVKPQAGNEPRGP